MRYPVEYVASELGVDRKRLIRQLEAAGTDFSQGVTFQEAFDALTSKAEREADRDRRIKAEARSAEMTAAEKEKTLMLRAEHETVVRELAVQTRARVQSAGYIEKEHRQRLTRELAEIEVTI